MRKKIERQEKVNIERQVKFINEYGAIGEQLQGAKTIQIAAWPYLRKDELADLNEDDGAEGVDDERWYAQCLFSQDKQCLFSQDNFADESCVLLGYFLCFMFYRLPNGLLQ